MEVLKEFIEELFIEDKPVKLIFSNKRRKSLEYSKVTVRPIMIAEEICDSKTSLAKLVEPIKLYPQYLKNVRVKDKAAVLADKNVLAAKEEVEKLINKKGRALLRESGTEPVIRVMIESETQELCIEYAEMIVKAIIEGGHSVE